MTAEGAALYRPAGAALLRASATPMSGEPSRWPDLEDAPDCRRWLADVWPRAADAIGLASSALAARMEQILGGHPVRARHVCGAAATVVRYLLRSFGRPTPFALFAGVAPARFGPTASVEFGKQHRSRSRADAAWLGGIIDGLEAGPVLPRLEVVVNTLAAVRAGRLVVPRAEGRAEIAFSAPVRVVWGIAREPVRFPDLGSVLAAEFPGVSGERIEAMLRELVTHRFLITCLRAPMTHTDPLGHLLAALHASGAGELDETATLVDGLEEIHRRLRELNELAETAAQSQPRAALIAVMNRLNPQARSPMAVDLAVDGDACLPESVARDMASAAGVLTRLGRQPLGPASFADYHRRFVERYGTGTVVALAEVVDVASGLGYPAGYPRSVLPKPPEAVTDRDRRLLALAWQALADGGRLELTDAMIACVTDGDLLDRRFIQPHVEIAARIRARTVEALQGGDYLLAVTPARSAGTLSARFQPVTGDAAMERAYREVPVLHEGAVPVQVSCPPLFVRGQNVARLPAFLPDVLTIGEPPTRREGQHVLVPDDLALTATSRGLLLLEAATGRIIDPQVFHALDLERQMPPLARFLAHLPRAYAAAFTALDFGPAAADLPHLPEVRYGRIILAPERWRIHAAEVPERGTAAAWRTCLQKWRDRVSCPAVVELTDGDMTLRLDLTVAAHAAILREHLTQKTTAVLNAAAAVEDYGWIGHAHEVVTPIVRAGPPAPSKVGRALPRRSNADGHRPADPNARWLSARVHTHPDAMDAVIAVHLPDLLAAVDDAPTWMVRYRNPEETDHLRIRVRTDDAQPAARAAALGAWAASLTEAGVIGRVVWDTYYPEVGRYGHGAAMDAAETVFCADTHAAIITLQQHPSDLHPDTLTALSLLDITEAFLGGTTPAADHLLARSFTTSTSIDRAAASAATRLARGGVPRELPHVPDELATAWATRAQALAAYRKALPDAYDPAAVLSSLLHLHVNRHRGINQDHEGAYLRLARAAALAWRSALRETPP